MRAFLLALVLGLFTANAIQAQALPFDMSGERPAGAAPPTAPMPVNPSAPAAGPAVIPPVSPQAPAPPPAAPAGQTTAPAVPSVSTPAVASVGYRRFLIPAAEFGLSGEIDRRTWSVYLTSEEAAAAARLNMAYRNAVVVAPESSKLTVLLNNRVVGQTAVSSPERLTVLSFEIPPGLLQAGSNSISFEIEQRHRTDCNVESTYELWTDVDPSQTYLDFGRADPVKLLSADAVRAVGVDETGNTLFNIIAPAMEQPGTTRPLMRLAQGLAVLSGMPNQSFSLSRGPLPARSPGKLTVLVGTAAEVQPILPSLPAVAQTAPLTQFLQDPRTGSLLLLITGPSWQAVETAIDGLALPTERAPDVTRDVLVTQRWAAPDAPLVYGRTDIPLAQLGVRTTQFSGRRFHTEFRVGVPSDFFATAYGEATILLDAAYDRTVLPGSHIDIYVNGNVASTVPISNPGGGIFRHLPIRVTLRHFVPGVNTIALEAVLRTEEDAVCAPGTSASAEPRFALFDSSVFRMPNFARVGQRPNLAAAVGTGYPYARATPLPVFVDRNDEDTLSAAATALGKLAVVSARTIPLEVVASTAAIGDRDAVFIGAISQMPPTVLSQLNISTGAQAQWRPAVEGQSKEVDTQEAFEEWRSRVRGGAWGGQISVFEDWMKRNFDISLSSLRFAPQAEETFMPSNSATLLIAQGTSPNDVGSWTLVAAPTGTDLRESVVAMTQHQRWRQIAGHITTFSTGTNKIETIPVTRFRFVATQPMSFTNYRLIAANWLSTNILSYAVLFVIASVLLGLATSALLSNLGRRE
ncbi:cellulose biosynthesis cyclic di-GMP-binding regulatory protein BcsB [Rhizobium sp. RAF56]|uniref:cellulose biosynthesis cyclic di-GMP-binding regulatory protein BcsB n=1 Tax=Rhizobium sp. RAF56 TaxID=3233062 RepID=UPI003F98EB0D